MKKNVFFINETLAEYEWNTIYRIYDSKGKIYKKVTCHE